MRTARKDFIHSLSIEYSAQFEEYLKKANAAIDRIKLDAYEKIKRKVKFNSGIDFYSDTNDFDESRRIGAANFRLAGKKLEVVEMNLDEK